MSKYTVFVDRDDRVPAKGYTMGFEPLHNREDVEVVFMPDRGYHELKGADIAGANAIITVEDLVTEDTIRGHDKLEVVASFGSGIDNIDIEGCTNQGIPAVNSPQGVGKSVAQTTLGMIIACASNSIKYNNLIRDQGFEGRWANMGNSLYEKTVGIIGIGQIGSTLVSLLEPFDVDVLAYDPYVDESDATDLGVDLVSLEALLRESDFVSLHCPLTEETQGMLGKDEFQTMKESAYLINTTRGGIYADTDLYTAVDQGWIAGVAVDVYEDEPNVEDNPLLELDDCWLTPHSAGLLKETLTEHGRAVSESILSVFDGEIPKNLLNPNVYQESVDDALISPSHREDATHAHYRS